MPTQSPPEMPDTSIIDHTGPAEQQPYFREEMFRINEMRRIGFAIEDALEVTPKGVTLQRPVAIFIKRALFDFADRAELEIA